MEMSLNLSNLTDTAQKNLTNILKKISFQRGIIEKEKSVIDTKGDTYICSRARNASQIRKERLAKLGEIFEREKNKLEDQFERQQKQLENEIEIQEKIIWDETNRESITIIRAKAEINILTREKDKILKATGVFETPVEPTPARQAPVPPPQEILEPQEISESSLDFAIFMRDGRQDGQPIDPNPSYLNSVALGACMTSKEKKKGVKMP